MSGNKDINISKEDALNMLNTFFKHKGLPKYDTVVITYEDATNRISVTFRELLQIAYNLIEKEEDVVEPDSILGELDEALYDFAVEREMGVTAIIVDEETMVRYLNCISGIAKHIDKLPKLPYCNKYNGHDIIAVENISGIEVV